MELGYQGINTEMTLCLEKRFIVAIDGLAAAGKGTIAKALSEKFGFFYLDTGLLYRAIASRVLDGNDPIQIARAFDKSLLSASDLRTAEVASMASHVAAIPEVRAALVDFQRDFAHQPGGSVLDGRDIGTVICPTANAKFFITASSEVRAQRRFEELQKVGSKTTYDAVLSDVKERDVRDISRKEAPLKAAKDAHIIDTTKLSIRNSVETVISIVQTVLKNSEEF